LFQQRDQGTARGVGLADLRSALEGKLSTGLDAQVLIPHLSETAEGGEEPAGSRSTVAVRRQGSDGGHNDVLVSGHPSHIAWVTGHDGDLAVGR
jgi:hypothetical protein